MAIPDIIAKKRWGGNDKYVADPRQPPNDGDVMRYDEASGMWLPVTFTHTHAVGDLTQSGATANQVLTWNGSAWAPATASAGSITVLEGLATADVTITTANTFYSPAGATISLTTGSWLIWAQGVVGRTATTATTYTSRIRDTTGGITLAECQNYMPSANPNYTSVFLVGMKVVPSGTTTVRFEATANQSTSSVIKAVPTINNSGTNVTTKIYALKFA